STKSPAELRPKLGGYEGKVCTIDANKISEEELGRTFPNTPMLAAIVKVTGVVDVEDFIRDMQASFQHKFSSKPQVIEGNMRALKRSMEEVQVG
ncbi:MAG: 2-oxoacid:acceptor oxidoreductase family protein, partial [Pseudoflavonifractor sp.]